MKNLRVIVNNRKFNKVEAIELNIIYSNGTKIMLNAKDRAQNYDFNSLWLPELHVVIKTLKI